MSTVVTELAVPDAPGEPGPRGDRFREFHEHIERANAARFGPGVAVRSPGERLSSLLPPANERRQAFVGHRDGRLVGTVQLFTPQLEATDVAEIVISTEPGLDAGEAKAAIEALLDHAESVAVAQGRTDLRGDSDAAASGPVVAATGYGGADPADPAPCPTSTSALPPPARGRPATRSSRGPASPPSPTGPACAG